MKYAFIRDNGRRFKLTRLCAALSVSRSGYYEWLGRPESRRAREDRQLLDHIRVLHGFRVSVEHHKRAPAAPNRLDRQAD